MNNLFKAFEQYRDGYGLNQDSLDEFGNAKTSQNGALFTVAYLIVLLEDETIPKDIKRAEVIRIRNVFKHLEPIPGLSRRSPTSTEPESMDNATALLTFSALFDHGDFARRTLEFGRTIECSGIDVDVNDPKYTEKNKKFYPLARLLNFFKAPRYYWNNRAPDKFCVRGWFGRSPGYMGLMQMAAGKYCGPFNTLALLVGQMLGMFKQPKDQDARTLPYIVWYFLKQKNWFWRWMYKLWVKKLLETYPNGIQSVYEAYFSNKQQPLIKYSPSHHKTAYNFKNLFFDN